MYIERTLNIEELNKINSFVKREKILREYDDMYICRTTDGKICIDVPKRDDVLSLVIDRRSKLIAHREVEMDMSDYIDRLAPGRYFETKHSEDRSITYIIQSSINGSVSDVVKVSTDMKYEWCGRHGQQQRFVEDGILPEEKEKITSKLRDSAPWARYLWMDFVLTKEDMEAREQSQKATPKAQEEQKVSPQEVYMKKYREFYSV